MSSGPIYILNDILFAFIRIDRVDILEKEFNKMVITPLIYEELYLDPTIKDKLDELIDKKTINLRDITVFTEEFNIFMDLSNEKFLGDNSASLLSKAFVNNGTFLARYPEDFSKYLNQYEIDSLSFKDLLDLAIKDNVITDSDVISILNKMLDEKIPFKEGEYEDLINFYSKKQ